LHEGKVIIKNNEGGEGFVLDESAYLEGNFAFQDLKITLKEDEYFVMGDNRRSSADSRRWGALPKKYIVGKVWIRAWPFTKFEKLEIPVY